MHKTVLSLPLAAAGMIAAVWVTPAAAAQRCLPYDLLVDHLAKSYDEHSQSTGVTVAGRLIEVFASEAGSFTVVLTVPKGVSCVVAAGDGWEITPAFALGPGA